LISFSLYFGFVDFNHWLW